MKQGALVQNPLKWPLRFLKGNLFWMKHLASNWQDLKRHKIRSRLSDDKLGMASSIRRISQGIAYLDPAQLSPVSIEY
jgi:hypothetical protein